MTAPGLRGAAAVAALATVTALGARDADAGGMVLHTRGVRATARAGALVAGVDDPGAMWLNPAGLAALAGGARRDLLVDAAYVAQDAAYDRIDGGGRAYPTVESQAGGLPIPAAAAAFDLGEGGVLGVGVWAPYAGRVRFDEDGPQRYAIVDTSHTAIATIAIGVAWRLGRWRLGATVQTWVLALDQTVVVSGCPGETLCGGPEDPEFDALTQLQQRSLWNPSGSIGVQVDATDRVTVGATVQAPVALGGEATLRTRLPSSGFYDGARVTGDRADVALTLPASARLGVEARPAARWRVEAALGVELWSMHDEIVITPRGVRIEDAPGVGTYELGPLAVPRRYEDTWSAALGVEGQPAAGAPLTVRAGYAYETAAAPTAYLSALTFDGARHLGALGVGYAAGRVTIDAVVGHVWVGERVVPVADARAPLLTPVRDPNEPPLVTYVNAGTYRTSWLLAGLGIRASF